MKINVNIIRNLNRVIIKISTMAALIHLQCSSFGCNLAAKGYMTMPTHWNGSIATSQSYQCPAKWLAALLARLIQSVSACRRGLSQPLICTIAVPMGNHHQGRHRVISISSCWCGIVWRRSVKDSVVFSNVKPTNLFPKSWDDRWG